MGYMKALYTDKIDCPMTLDAVGGTERNRFVPLPSSTPTPFDNDPDLEPGSHLDDFTMPAFKRDLDEYIVGQENAKKQIAQIVWSGCMCEHGGGVSTNLIIGRPGSGKTAIMNALYEIFPKVTHWIDMSMISAEGWKGMHMSDCLKAIPDDGRYHIVLLDEFDKLLHQRNGEADFHMAIQSNLLRMFQHDPLPYKGCCQPDHITWICAGAFDELWEKKKKRKTQLGFTADSEYTEEDGPISFSEQDLIEETDLMSQLVSRFDRIITLDEPDLPLYQRLARKTVQDLSEVFEAKILIDDETLDALSTQALESAAGSRAIRKTLRCMIEDYIWDNPHYNEIDLRRPAMEM